MVGYTGSSCATLVVMPQGYHTITDHMIVLTMAVLLHMCIQAVQ